jgi:hypothetical protein
MHRLLTKSLSIHTMHITFLALHLPFAFPNFLHFTYTMHTFKITTLFLNNFKISYEFVMMMESYGYET